MRQLLNFARRQPARFILTVSCIISLLCFAPYVWKFHSYKLSNNPTDWGTFGDYTGGIIGTIIGLFAAIFLILTLESQNKIKHDSFFFMLIQLYDKQMQTLSGRLNNIEYESKRYYRRLLEECRKKYHIYKSDEVVIELLKSNLNNLSSYITTLEEIIKFIDVNNKSLLRNHSINYTNIFIAQISNDEKIILGYLCALDIIPEKTSLINFYKKNNIRDTINYEMTYAKEKTKRPDAIKEILDKLG